MVPRNIVNKIYKKCKNITITKGRKDSEMYDIIIIGAGPAGISAAIYGKSRGKNVLVLEKIRWVD